MKTKQIHLVVDVPEQFIEHVNGIVVNILGLPVPSRIIKPTAEPANKCECLHPELLEDGEAPSDYVKGWNDALSAVSGIPVPMPEQFYRFHGCGPIGE